MRVKEIDRTANVAWSPAEQHPIYIAAGTAAQQLDATFSTSAALELYTLNLGEPGFEMEPVGSIPSDYRFHKLCWGQGIRTDENSAGVLVGGADNGNIFLWDPNAILKGEDPLIEKLQKHTGAVAALDFNPFQNNLLASGGSESEIVIWDLNNTGSTMGPGQKSQFVLQPPDDVTCVAWNRQVQHILASTYAGRCVVWDLRKNEPIIKVSDSMSRIKCKLVCWHPEVATQMCMSSEDDHSPVIQLWDLRFATSPLKILENHQRGILSMAWCPQDPDLLLSCGKDNRILCWDPNTHAQMGEVVYELPTSNQWSFDVQWCPRNPSVISSCSFDGHVSIYSLMGGSKPDAAPRNKIADSFGNDQFQTQAPQQAPSATQEQPVALKKPPKWIRRPVGATFGFGGKLITFENPKNTAHPQQQQQQGPVQRQVVISQVVTEVDLVARSAQLENALNSGQYAEFCSLKVANSKNDLEENVWNFLKVQFEKDPRTKYLDLLGYDQAEIAKKVADVTESSGVDDLAPGPDAGELSQKMSQLDTSTSDQDLSGSVDGAEAFEQISKSELETLAKTEAFPFSTKDDCDGLITQALLTANFQAAVEVCLHNNRMAEAVILAIAGGPELLQQTQKKFFEKQQEDSVNRLICSVVTRDYEQVVKNCDLRFWKEALAVSLTYAKGQQFASLCDLLGARLEAESDTELSSNAVLCYICAGNIPKLVECWSKITKDSNSPRTLQDLVEKVMILRKSIETQSGMQPSISSEALAEKLSKYSELLAAQGSLSTAINYLGSSNELQLAILRDRLCEAIPNYQGVVVQKPFNVINVQPQGMKATQNQQQVQQQRQQMLSQQNNIAGAPGQRQRTNSGYYQAPSSGNFNTSTTPMYNNYNYPGATVNTSQYNPGVPQGPGQMPNTGGYSGYNQPAVPNQGGISGPTAISKGPLASKYPGHHQPTSTAYDNYPSPNIYNPVSSAYDGYNTVNNAYPTSQAHTPSQIYDPTTMAPGAPPQSVSQPVHNAVPSYQDHTPPQPGWNDPPLLKPKKKEPTEASQQPQPQPAPPITTPIYGVPQPEQTPPGAPSYIGHTQVYNPHEYAQHQPVQSTQPPPKPEPPKPVEKKPIPSEHQMLQQTFDKLANQCLQQSNNPHIKRKLEDVLRKLEVLYDKLRDDVLSQNVILGLHQIIQAIQAYDYQSALAFHSQMVSQGNFSEISSFMPGVKMLMQTAMQMNVYVQ